MQSSSDDALAVPAKIWAKIVAGMLIIAVLLR